MKEIFVRNFLGDDLNYEEAVILRQELKKYLQNDIILNFQGVEKISNPFFATLLTDSIYNNSRKYVLSHLKVKNLTNLAFKDFCRVIYGTSLNVA